MTPDPSTDHDYDQAERRAAAAELAMEVTRFVERLDPKAQSKIKRVIRASNRRSDLAAEFERIVNAPGNELAMHGSGLGASLSVEDGRKALAIVTDALSDDWARSELLGASALAVRLNVSIATLANWRASDRIVGFLRDRRNYLYPVRQFYRGRPTPGVGAVVARFATTEDAWEWLVEPNLYTAGYPPIDRLQAGHSEEVDRAAEGAFDFA